MNQNNDTRWYFPAERLEAYRVARELVIEVARVSKGWRGELRVCERARGHANRPPAKQRLAAGDGAQPDEGS